MKFFEFVEKFVLFLVSCHMFSAFAGFVEVLVLVLTCFLPCFFVYWVVLVLVLVKVLVLVLLVILSFVICIALHLHLNRSSFLFGNQRLKNASGVTGS